MEQMLNYEFKVIMQTEKRRAYMKQYYAANAEKQRAYFKQYYAENSEKKRAYKKQYYAANPEKKRAYMKQYCAENSDKRRDYYRRWCAENPEKKRACDKQYCAENSEKRRACQKRYMQQRLETDPEFRFKCATRNLISKAFKRGGFKKNSRTEKILGCSFAVFQAYITSLFQPGMTLKNYGEWHIDHIIPLKLADTIEQTTKLNHYTNMQPMWEDENLKKSSKFKGTLDWNQKGIEIWADRSTQPNNF